MTKLTFEQLKKDSRFKTASKPWYKDYPFKVVFRAWDMFDGNWTNMFHKYTSVKVRMHSLGHEIKFRHDTNFSLYLKTLEAVDDVIYWFDGDIMELHGPISKLHHDTLIDDLSVVTRSKLFYNKYRYKVSCHVYRYKGNMDIFEDIADFVNDTFEPNQYYTNSTIRNYRWLKEKDAAIQHNAWGGRYRWLPYTATGTVYFKQYEDMCTFHLLFKPHITSSTKVVLIEDLE